MKKCSKLLCAFLVVCMMITICPMAAFALPAGAEVYTDVPKDHWAAEYIYYWSNVPAKNGTQNVIGGYADGSFRPDESISRGATAAILDRIYGFEATSQTVNFNDLTNDNVFLKSIMACADKKIVQGYPDGSFRPNNSVSRQAAIAMIARCAMTQDDFKAFADKAECLKILSERFTDANLISSDFYAEFCFLLANGNLDGYPDGSVRPVQPITRAQFVKLLYTATKNESKPVDPSPAEPAADQTDKYNIEVLVTDGTNLVRGSTDNLSGDESFAAVIMSLISANRNELYTKFKTDNIREVITVVMALYNMNRILGWSDKTKSDWNNYVHESFKDASGDAELIDAFADVDSAVSDLKCGTYQVLTPKYLITVIVNAE